MNIRKLALQTSGAAALVAALFAADRASAQEAAPGDDIVVTAQQRNQTQVKHGGSLGALGDKDAMDVPFAIKSYDNTLILNQQSQTLGQVLENDSSVRTSLGYGNASEQFVIRGFPLYGEDIAIDGLYGITPRQLVSPELYDSVQILNGASAFLFGAAPGGTALGGTVNLEPKRATAKTVTRLTANYQSTGHLGGAFDVGRRFGPNDEFGVRVNGAGRWGDVAIDDEYRSSTVLGLGTDWHNAADTIRLSLDLAYQRAKVEHMRPMVQLSGVSAIPAPPRADINYGQPWNYTTLRDIFGIAKLEADLAKDVTFYASFGARDSAERGNYQGFTVTDAATGAARTTGSKIPRNDNNEAGQAGIRAKFSFAGISNEINIGGSHTRMVNRNAYGFGNFSGSPNNLYNPVSVPVPDFGYFAGGNIGDPFPISRIRTSSLFFSDTIGFLDDRILVIAGLRRQNLDIRSYSYGTGAQSGAYNQSATTPVAGLVIKPSETISIYFNRIEGLVQGPVAPAGTINVGQIYPPYRAVQYEVGGKLALGNFNASLALFQTDKPQSYVYTNGGGQQVFTVDGIERHKGIELSVDGEPTKGLRIIAGLSVTDAKQKKTTGGTYDGKIAIGVPDYTANANVEWDLGFLPGVTLTGRAMLTGKQYFNQDNSLKLDSWTRFDLGARYVVALSDTPVTFRFNVDNVANNRYWASSLGGYLVQGLPRTVKLSATVDF